MNDLQQKVLDYISNKDQRPLRFFTKNNEFLEENFDNLKNMPLNDLVYYCVNETRYNYSYNIETESIETTPNRWRSSLDIWRHIKYYKPEVTIFEVMKTLWDIRNDLGGHFCHDIFRRVFKSNPDLLYTMMAVNELDEYRLDWEEWEHILEEQK